MKSLIAILLMTSLILLPTFSKAGNKEKGDMQGNMMGMMSHDQMMAMHQHMKEKKALMNTIKNEDDMQKRHDLMQQHMASMMKGMRMMSGEMGEGMSMRKGMKGDEMKSRGMMGMEMDMEKRMDMMESRMGMMQMMMQQMMEHQFEAKKMSAKKRKN